MYIVFSHPEFSDVVEDIENTILIFIFFNILNITTELIVHDKIYNW